MLTSKQITFVSSELYSKGFRRIPFLFSVFYSSLFVSIFQFAVPFFFPFAVNVFPLFCFQFRLLFASSGEFWVDESVGVEGEGFPGLRVSGLKVV